MDISFDITKGERQEQFVELLRRLTDMGKVEWAQSEREPGFVYCRLDVEYLVFDVRGGAEADPVRPGEQVGGIVCLCRNVTYLWLEGLYGWDTLLELLRQAPNNHERFIGYRRATFDLPTRVLERLLET